MQQRPVTMTLAPSLMNDLAVVKPIPVVPPVSSVFPLSLSTLSPVFICLEALHTEEYDHESYKAMSFVRDGI